MLPCSRRLVSPFQYNFAFGDGYLSQYCGYRDLPIRSATLIPEIPFYLKPGLGACMEYNNASSRSLPVGPPDPFVDTPTSDYCVDNDDVIYFWFDFVANILIIFFLLRLRKASAA